MKLTYEIPSILIDTTNVEPITELINKLKILLSSQEDYILASQGDGTLKIKSISSITSSVVNDIRSVLPIKIDSTTGSSPIISFDGVLQPSQGGTGLNIGSFTTQFGNGKLLISTGNAFSLNTLTAGSDISIINGAGEITINNTLTSISRPKNLFLASPNITSGNAAFRLITTEDIPSNLSSKTLTNSILTGSVNGSFIGNGNGSFTGLFFGNGAGITSLNAANITSGVVEVPHGGTGAGSFQENAILLGNNIYSFKTLTGSAGEDGYALVWAHGQNRFQLSASVGSGVGVVPTEDGQVLISYGGAFKAGELITDSKNNIIITEAEPNLQIDLADEIVVNKITANTASIGILNYQSQNQLSIGDKYIVILSGASDHPTLDGSGIQWGSGSSGTTYDDLGSHAHIRFNDTYDSLQIFPRLTTEYITASHISGTYYGDGSGITGVIAANVIDGAKYALTGAQNIFTTDQVISGNLYVSSSVSASSYEGSGLALLITASQITALREQVLGYMTGSSNITVSDGTSSLNDSVFISTLTASTHVSSSTYYGDGSTLRNIQNTTGNITGSGTFTNPYTLKDNISLVSVTASYFNGDGGSITGIKAENIIDTLPVEHGGTGLSSLVSGALYIASSTSSLVPFTGSDFQLIAWDSAASRWQSYSQPYDIAAEFSGSYDSGSVLLQFRVPRNMTFVSASESINKFEYRINNFVFLPASNQTASANDLLTVYATSGSSNQYLTLLGQLR